MMFNFKINKSGFAIGMLMLLSFVGIALGQNSLFLSTSSQERGRFGADSASGGAVGGAPMILADEVGVVSTSSEPVLQASWITVEEPRPKNFRIHDLVTIIVNEVSSHSTSAEAETDREYGLDASLDEWFRFTRGGLRASAADNGQPKLSFSASREFDGSGDITREDSLSARIRAEVVDVLPNGNLVLEATHSVTTDDETTHITLTGICSGSDLGMNNTVLSSQLASLCVEKTHTGMARDATKRGLISGLLEFLNLL